MKKKVLITGGRSPVALYLSRLFSKSGYDVYVAETFDINMTAYSSYIKKNILIPPPAQKTEEFIKVLRENIINFKIDILIPTCEEIFYISKFKSQLDEFCNVVTENFSILKELHSKYLFMQMLERFGVKFPETKKFTDIESIKKEIANKDFFVIKPEFSRFASLAIINDRKKIESIEISESYPWVVQEFLDGEAYCSYCIAKEGKVLAHSIYPSIYRAGQGATIYYESVFEKQIDEIVFKIVKELNYTGQISFDFIKSSKDGIVYPIECNPRPTSGVFLFSEKDNLPLAFEGVLNNMIRPTDYKNKTVVLAMLIYALPKIKSFSEAKKFVKDIINSKDPVIEMKDLKPFLAQFLSLKYYSKISKEKKISFLEATTYDIEWNGD